MATAAEKHIRPEDLLAITDRPMPELVNGQLVEREMGQKADAVALVVASLLRDHAKQTNAGLVNGSQCGYQIFADDPDKVRIPDASFTRRERLAMPSGAEGHSRVAPDLVVEVISPRDSAAELRVKIREYLNAEIPLVWVVNPDDRSVEIYRPDGTATLLGPEGTLETGEVLPGFSCSVAALFEV